MDQIRETHTDKEVEYVAPAIVDYGTLVEVTASNRQNNLSDLPLGNGILGYSTPAG
jgi:hypothetical protein